MKYGNTFSYLLFYSFLFFFSCESSVSEPARTCEQEINQITSVLNDANLRNEVCEKNLKDCDAKVNELIEAVTVYENQVTDLTDSLFRIEKLNSLQSREIENLINQLSEARKDNNLLSEQNQLLVMQNEGLIDNILLLEDKVIAQDSSVHSDILATLEMCNDEIRTLYESYYFANKETVDKAFVSLNEEKAELERVGAWKPTIPEYERVNTAIEMIKRLYSAQKEG